MPEQTIYLKNYQPPVFKVNEINLIFDLYDEKAIITSELSLSRQSKGELELYGDELSLIALYLDGKKLTNSEYYIENGNLFIPDVADDFSLKIVTETNPIKNTKLSGLYRSNHLFCTQCEAEGFRRITFFPDRPDVLTLYRTKIIANKTNYPVLLSNGNLIDSGLLENDRHWVLWEDPFKKPSYLFALVAGNLSLVQDKFITFSGREIDLHIYVEPGNEDQCSHAMNSLKKAMRWDEEIYGREYDLDIFMIVAVSDFNMGAMENKGLNIFNAKYILARPDTATDQDFADIEGVVGHEYFHNWTGNRITCRDWFQLSLKEGLTVFRDQEFSRDMNSRDLNRILDVKVLKNAQFPEDAGAMAHPVRPDSYQEINNFYTATVYNKGAEVIRMQETILGKKGFLQGMSLYFERHDGQAVTIDDFVKAMEDANDVDLTQFKRWYNQAGTPEVKVQSMYQEGILTLNFTQYCRPTSECHDKKPFHIPIRLALYDKEGMPISIASDVLELKEVSQTFTFNGLKEKPTISLLRDFSAPIKLYDDFEPDSWQNLVRYESDGYAKWNAAQHLSLNCIHGFLKNPKEEWKLPHALVETFQYVLEDINLDNALKAEILMPPSFEEVISNCEQVDVDAVERARDFYRQALGGHLYSELFKLYTKLWEEERHQMNSVAYSQRRLRNTCLWLMMKADENRILSHCELQFLNAQTMTDQIASLGLLRNSSQENLVTKVLQNFYQQWSHNDLVIDKWFSIQALGENKKTLNLVKELIHHADFNFKNPNKVRALIGSFCQANHRNFHDLNGSGYRFLTEMLQTLDKINPQIASRLATPFTRLNHFDEARRKLMHDELKQLASLNLSRDLREIVQKSLAD